MNNFNRYIKSCLTKLFSAQMKRIIARNDIKIIGIVGSVGKTATKLAVAEILRSNYKVQVQQGNYNTPLSVPFIFFGRDLPNIYNPFGWFNAWLHAKRVASKTYPYEIVIVELGTDTPGDIIAYKPLLQLDVAIVTAISEEHMEHFESLDAVAKEELSVSRYAKSLIINCDDVSEEYLAKFLPSDMPATRYGFNGGDYNFKVSREDDNRLKMIVDLKNGQKLEVPTKMIAEQSAKSIAAAIVIADRFGQEPSLIKEAAKAIMPPPGRMNLLNGIKESQIIDDSYNSSPLAAKAALKTLAEIEAPQKIAVLGQMNELGVFSAPSHRSVGELCQPGKIDLLITIGKDANGYLADAAAQNGCRVVRCHSPIEAGNILAGEIEHGAIVLVKGSQNGVFAEETIKLILADSKDTAKLVRQSDFWLNKKRAQFKDCN